MNQIDFTHDPQRRSWIDSANEPATDFPIQNLPFGLFQANKHEPRIGIAIGDQILDLSASDIGQRIDDPQIRSAIQGSTLNPVMELNKSQRIELRHAISEILAHDTNYDRDHCVLREQGEVELLLPAKISDYTDFYASVYHATNVGSMFRPDNPLLPNYKHIPIGYHGRSSSIGVSGQNVVRPVGQKAPAEGADAPTIGPSSLLDYEFEVGFFVAQGNALGKPISIKEAEDRIFGMVLVNDWSARDLQKWEYQPLGPFLAKSFATTISPWVVTMEALAPFRCAEFKRGNNDPQPLDYLTSESNTASGGVDITLSAFLRTEKMRQQAIPAEPLSQTSFTNMYWTIAQMLTHHSSNGCNMQPGDLLASGTVSGPTRGERGCLLELTWNGDLDKPVPGSDRTPIQLPTGEERKFLADGDEIIFAGSCESEKYRRIGFGRCVGTIQPAATA